MSERTIEAPPVPSFSERPAAEARRRRPVLELLRGHPELPVAAALAVLGLIVVLVARTRPGYDPYGWLVWGRQTLHWNLDTNGAPSWKPLAYIFTVPYSLLGHYSLWLWMVTSVGVSLSGLLFAYRIAYRLTNAPKERQYAAVVAGVLAAIAVLGVRDYTHFILSSQSDTMIVALCLGAIDFHLSGRARVAFVFWVLASLGRPEVWPFLGLYSLWAWRAVPEMRREIIGGLAVMPVLWFGITALTSKSPFSAGNLALESPRAIKGNKITGVIDRFFKLHEWQAQVAALFAAAYALYRRERFILVLAAGAIVWVIVEIAFALHGWPAVPRYLFEPVAVVGVLAGIGIGKALIALPGRTGALAGAAASVVLVASIVPAASTRVSIEKKDLAHEHQRTTRIDRLHALVAQLGGARILSCGQPRIVTGFQSVLAYDLGTNIGILFFNTHNPATFTKPSVNFDLHGNGWSVHTLKATGRCASLTGSTPFQ